jgi:hypothetical protein
MPRIWVLDTETKGTGAEMVPLERALEGKRSAPVRERISVIKRKPRRSAQERLEPAREREPRPPRRFRVVNAISGQLLAADACAREVSELLDGMRSVADARIVVWEPEDDAWRPLTLREQTLLRGPR